MSLRSFLLICLNEAEGKLFPCGCFIESIVGHGKSEPSRLNLQSRSARRFMVHCMGRTDKEILWKVKCNTKFGVSF